MKKKIVLSLSDLHVSYGNIQALKGVSVEVEEGKIVALLGANGAGKSTVLRAVSGLVTPTSGDIKLYDKKINGLSPEKIVAEGLVQSPEGRQIFPDITVEENLRIGAFCIKNKAQIDENFEMVYTYFERLRERRKQVAGTLSGGEQQMLAIGRALMASPKILLLDEPSLGLAPLIVKDIFEIVKVLNKNGVTVLIIEQNAVQTLKIADYAYVLEVGNISHQGEASSLLKDPKIVDAYLGKN